jgi:UPF0755 protein
MVALFLFALSPPITTTSTPTSFSVATGESAASILSRLEHAGFIRSALATRIYLKLTGQEKKLVPGDFTLPSATPASDLIHILSLGPKDILLTIPEGWRREQIGIRLRALNPNFDYSGFIEATASIEGQLFPDSYLVPKDITTGQAIRLFTSNFAKKTNLYPQNPQDKNILIIASLIEREANTVPDRPLVSSVINNRLALGMALQIDATVQYAIDSHTCLKDPFSCTWWQPVTDTKFPSIYNTYLHPELPPTPICNPGLSAITAAKNPDKSKYLYYITGNDGITRFARDLGSHQANVDKYLRL